MYQYDHILKGLGSEIMIDMDVKSIIIIRNDFWYPRTRIDIDYGRLNYRKAMVCYLTMAIIESNYTKSHLGIKIKKVGKLKQDTKKTN